MTSEKWKLYKGTGCCTEPTKRRFIPNYNLRRKLQPGGQAAICAPDSDAKFTAVFALAYHGGQNPYVVQISPALLSQKMEVFTPVVNSLWNWPFEWKKKSR